MMVNTKHDTTSYENCSCQREIYDGNALYDAYLRAKSGSDWKPQVQRYEIAYPIPIDNYIKIVKGVKFYGRYMDDSYVIHRDKEFLKGLLIEIVEIAHDLGITVNLRKTRICKLSEMWRFLQIQYSLTDTGRVIHKIHPKRLTGMRRKAKKLALILSEKDFDDWFRSWFNGHCHYMSKLQRSNMLDLCKKLKEEHYYGKTDFS